MARTVAAVMALPPPPEIAKRVRAAFAYAGEDVTKEHPQLEISKATLARIVSRTSPRGADQEELERVAAFTKVPLTFLVDGWPNGTPLPEERVDAVEFELTALRGQVNQLRAGLAALAGGTLPTLPARQVPGETDRPGEHQAGNG